MKQQTMMTLVMALIFSFLCFVSLAAGAQKILPAPAATPLKPAKCSEPPDTQVVNNSGMPLFQVKVGTVIFHENLSACTDGCSTGFQKIPAGHHPVEVKMDRAAAWVNIGSLGPFEGCLHHAVNIVKKGDTLCAELYVRKDTHPTFNNDSTRKKIRQVCKPMAPSPVLKTDPAPDMKKQSAPSASSTPSAPTAPAGMAARAHAAGAILSPG